MIKFNIQLFADGSSADGSEGDAVSTANMPTPKAKKSNPLSDVKYGKQPVEVDKQDETEDTEDNTVAEAKKTFDELLEDEDYKNEYKSRVEKAIKNRFKDEKSSQSKFDKLAPALRYLSERFNVDANDYEALAEASNRGLNELYEERAIETGTDADVLRKNSDTQYENNVLKSQIEQIKAEREQQKWMATMSPQIEEAKRVYPNFDFNAESESPVFRAIVNGGYSVKEAYEMVHNKELTPQLIKANTEDVTKKLSSAMASNKNRPSENGISSNATANIKTNPRDLTKADREEIKKRVRRGEKIIW